MSLLPESLASWIVIAVLLFWFVGAYNRLVRLRAAVLQAYGALDAALARQLDFVQTSITTGPPPEVAPTGESLSTIAPLQAATTQLSTLLGATRTRPLDAGVMAALATALQVWINAWRRQHPDDVTVFDADGTLSRPAQLMPAGVSGMNGMSGVPAAIEPIAWPEPSAAAEIARNQFNQAVGHYNAAIAQFPALLVAWAVRLRPAAPLL
ncbi:MULTISPECIES: lema family protein [unclassified Variovorax]|jgi:LemA protein|uniref:lema family protein n=1 Tax=unclassified Variovorax TaxID=663243 RepID=UPI0008B4D813|nr:MULTISPECIES: lema family protein [unclassified Variovorax]SEI89332.1 LemA protein [Variovorax sp. OK202]SFB82646.1 LemA protein [Variovorax sp. OK212]